MRVLARALNTTCHALKNMEEPRNSILERCLVTLGAIALVLAGASLLTLPGLDARMAYLLPPSVWPWANGSVFALGSTSFFLSAVLVDLGRRCRPSVGRRIRANPASRARWVTAVYVLAMLIALPMAYASVRSVHAVVPLSMWTKVAWLVLLLAGQVVLAALAWWVSHRGIGQGFALMAAFGILGDVRELLEMVHGPGDTTLSFGDSVRFFGTPVFIAVLTAFVVWPRSAKAGDFSWRARAPLCGVGPLILTFSLATFVTALALFGWVDARHAAAMTPGTRTFTVVASLFTVVVSVLLAYANHASVLREGDARVRTAFWRAMPGTLLFVLVFAWRPEFIGYMVIDPLHVVIVTAVGLDVVAEVQARRAYGSLVVVAHETDVDVADELALRLQRAQVPVIARGVLFATMTRFCGVLVPIELMVPAHQQGKAQQVVRTQGI